MKRLYELINLYYDTAHTYKKLFADNEMNKVAMEKIIKKGKLQQNLLDCLYEYIETSHFYYLLKSNKTESLENIEKTFSCGSNIFRVINKIQYDIDENAILKSIDNIYTLFYETLSINDCHKLVIKKYGKDFNKFWNLYLDMRKLEKSLLDHLKIMCS